MYTDKPSECCGEEPESRDAFGLMIVICPE
jgi:hypothetical protein